MRSVWRLGTPPAVTVYAAGSVSALPAVVTRTAYVPTGRPAGKVAVICVNVSTLNALGAYVVVPSAATSATVVPLTKPAPVSVRVAGLPLPAWLGVRPTSLLADARAVRV